MDLWVIPDGRIIMGEAKSTSALASNRAGRVAVAKRYAQLAATFTADEVVFVTSQAAWDSTTAEVVAQAFRGTRISHSLRSLVPGAAEV